VLILKFKIPYIMIKRIPVHFFVKSLLLLATVFFTKSQAQAQVFWSEDFTTNTWNLNVPTGPEGPDANFFIVADFEGGGITPNLGAPASCGVAMNSNNTLHLTSILNPTGGAMYDAGGLCPLLSCPQTDKRAESPTINCTGMSNITLSFNYIENGDGTNDDATLWYFDGSTWAMISNMPKTLTGCTGQGLWTSHSVNLPASADNNPNVKIAFGWINNDDGVGTDPSFAVDDITLSVPPAATSITTSNLNQTSLCACNTYQVSFTSTGVFTAGNVYTVELSNAAGSFASPVNIGTLNSTANSGSISATIPCLTPNGTQYRVRVVSSNPAFNGTDNGTDLSISSNPIAPNTVLANPAGLCDPGGTVQLSAVSTGNSINWYTAAVGGNYLGNTASAANLPVNLTTTTTFYAEALIGGIAVSGTSTFNYNGGMQTFVVPPGITSIQVECYGAQGANGIGISPGTGGLGAYVSGTMAVTPGQTLNIFVGGQGSGTTGGYNGGGNGGGTFGGGGGGATDIRVGGIALANRVVVAGGGGGGGASADGCTANYMGGNGGSGGGVAGQNGMSSPNGGGGFGGTLGAGGAPGIGCANFLGMPGTVPNGGEGQFLSCNNTPDGGGGGGGYVAGGGGGGGSLGSTACTGNDKGGGGGGAGGETFTGSLTSIVSTNGIHSGNGQVVITWNGSPTSCVSSTRTPVTVNVNPIPTVTANPASVNVCPNSPVTLSGGGAATYSWAGPQSISNGVSFNAITPGTYTVTGTSAAGCTSTATAIVDVIPVSIVANATPAASVCVGNQLAVFGSGGVSYTWSGGVGDNVPFTPSLGTTVYTVTGTDVNGCTSTSTINITGNPLPNAPTGLTSVPASVCMPGGLIDLTAISTNNIIDWYDSPTGGILLGSSLSGVPFTTAITTTTTYYAETSLIGVNGCVSTTRTPITVVVHPLPTVTSTPAQATGCSNLNLTLSGGGASFYTWTGPQTIQNNVPFVATTSGTYTVTGTDQNGCSNTTAVVVTINPLPTVSASVSPSATICEGASVTLTGSGAATYTWSGGVTNNIPFTPSASNTYTVVGSDAIGCTGTASISVNVTPSANPLVALNANPTIVYPGIMTTYIATVPPSVSSYQLDWFKNNTFFTTTFSPTNTISFIPASEADSVYVVMTPLAGCYNPVFKKSNTVLVRYAMDIPGFESPAGFALYPNPTQGIVNLQGIEANDQLTLTDVVGRTVFQKTFESNADTQLSLQSLTSGIYHARFTRQGMSWVVRMIKE
jgi:hypothetical protein